MLNFNLIEQKVPPLYKFNTVFTVSKPVSWDCASRPVTHKCGKKICVSIYLDVDLFENCHNESVETFKPYLRGFPQC